MLISRALLQGHGGERSSNSRSFIHHRWSKTAGSRSGDKVHKHAHQSRVNDVCCIKKKRKKSCLLFLFRPFWRQFEGPSRPSGPPWTSWDVRPYRLPPSRSLRTAWEGRACGSKVTAATDDRAARTPDRLRTQSPVSLGWIASVWCD